MRMAAHIVAALGYASSALGLARWKSRPGEEAVGIGFELTDDYAVASACCDAGTYIDIAKIEGDAAYKACIGMATRGQWAACSPSENGLSSMIQELKAATEAKLEQSVLEVQISLPYGTRGQPNFEAFNETLIAALGEASMETGRRLQTSSIHAGHAHGAGSCSNTADPQCTQLVLVAENTRAALILTLHEVSGGVWVSVRSLYSAELGTAALDHCDQKDDEKCEKLLKDAVRQMIKLPVAFEGNVHKKLDSVAIFGEASNDKRLKDVLHNVFRAQNSSDLIEALMRVGPDNTTFSASRGTAWNDYISKVWIDGPGPGDDESEDWMDTTGEYWHEELGNWQHGGAMDMLYQDISSNEFASHDTHITGQEYLSDSLNNRRVEGTSVGIGIAIIAGAAVYAAAMFFIMRRYQRRRRED